MNEERIYFIALDGKAAGPVSIHTLSEYLENQKISPLHFIWKEGWDEWKRLYEDPEFTNRYPTKPKTSVIEKMQKKLSEKRKKDHVTQASIALQTKVQKSENKKLYYLYFNNTQSGPFSKEEVDHIIKTSPVTRHTFVWTAGWSNWKRITELKEFAPHIEESEKTFGVKLGTKAGIDASDKRSMPRRPLVARLFIHNDENVIIAVCRDISIGGMQVLTDQIPGTVGSKIKLNVSPASESAVKSFVAEGEIVRILEDNRGFSFRFTKLSPDTKKAILNHIDEE